MNTRALDLFAKRLLDIVMASLGLVLALPILLAAALAVRFTLGRPVLFRQVRPGKHGKPFCIYKFRTMSDARDQNGSLKPDGERLTPLGHILRKLSIDELPQLWNVLRGHMSLVGPRPLLMQYLDRFSPQQNRRHEVRPGITGWAQVNGRNSISWEDKLELDVWYVDHRNLWLDLKILLRTVWKAIRRQGITAEGEATAPEFLGTQPQTASRSADLLEGVHVLGAGGHASVVISTLLAAGYQVQAVYDDAPELWGNRVLGVPILGPLSQLKTKAGVRAIIALGDCAKRKELARQFALDWISVIHPSAYVDPSAVIGKGTVVFAGAVIQPRSQVGDHVIINTASSVDHDCSIADFAHVGPGARLAGNVQLGEGALLGVGSVARPGSSVGPWSTVGAAGVVIQNIPAASLAMGCPARVVPAPDVAIHASQPTTEPNALRNHECQTGGRVPHASEPDVSPATESEMPRLFLSLPHMSGKEMACIGKAFDVNYVSTAGPQLESFERRIAEYLEVPHCVAVASGTAALHLALRHLGLHPGDEVVCSTLTFCASANPIVYEGAVPVFIDSDRSSWNLDPNLLEVELAECASRGRLPRAVIAVDIFGQSADMQSIVEIASKYDIPVIEDAAEALGATYRGKPVGGQGWASFFSFNGNKIITTGGGGALCSEDRSLIDRARYLSTQARDPAPHYQHTSIGYNYRMSNVLAAIGLAQLEVLEERVAARRRNFEFYEQHLNGLPGISFMPEADYGQSSRWLTVILVDPKQFGAPREDIRLALAAENIESRPVWKPLHLQPVFSSCRCRGGSVAESLFENGLCLPSGSAMTEHDLERVVRCIRNIARPLRLAG